MFHWIADVMTGTVRALAAALIAVLCLSGTVLTAVQPPPERQEEYVPVDQLPPAEQYPVLPLLVGAYVFVLAVLFLYLVSLGRRLTAVQREVQRLETDLKRTGRA